MIPTEVSFLLDMMDMLVHAPKQIHILSFAA